MQQNFVIESDRVPKFVRGTGPIFLVDDDEEQHQIVAECYEISGKKNPLVFFFDGQSFLEALNKVVDTNDLPVLVLLDINMPVMDGFSVLAEVKKNPKFESIPVIVMLTASNREEDVEKAKALKADGYFSKPMGIKKYISFFEEI